MRFPLRFSSLNNPTRRPVVWLIPTGLLPLVVVLGVCLLGASLTTTAQTYNPNGVTVAGGNDYGSAANQLGSPVGVYVDATGAVYIADANNNRIQRWAPGATQGVTVAGGNDYGNAANQLNYPENVFVDPAGNVYVSDGGNNRVQRWAPGATQGVTVAGSNDAGYAANQLSNPQGLYVDATGAVYIADFYNHRVQRWAPGATQGVTVAGSTSYGSAANQLNSPTGVWLDAAGNVYVADFGNSRIQRWAPGATQGVTVAGGNGYGSAANQLSSPEGLFVDGNGTVYVADTYNDRIQRWTPGASQGVTVAGGNGYGSAANQLADPQALYVDPVGTLYVVESPNNRVQRFDPIPTITGFSARPNPLCVGQTSQFIATVNNAGTYSFTLTNGVDSPLTGTASGAAFSQSRIVSGAGTQIYTLTVATNGGTATAITTLTIMPQSPDYQPLADLYNSTSGRTWHNNTNWLTGCTPCGWAGVTCNANGRVTGLNLLGNNLTGTIPASISALTGLVSLEIGNNTDLTGGIPTGIGNLANLQQINLSQTTLGGPIPASIGNLTSLTALYVNNSQLTGGIPASLGNLTMLKTLTLASNQLTGSVPANLGNLTQLQFIYLSYNQLSGPIPASLGNLTNILALFLNNNQLSGCFPASLTALCRANISFDTNPGLPGGGDFGAFCRSGAGSDAFRPLATASPNPVCTGNPVSLSVSAGTFYQWSGPAGFAATTQTPGFTPASAASSGVYTVTVGNGSRTCTATASVSLTVNPTPPTPALTTQSGQNGQLYPGGQASVSVPQYSGSVTLLPAGCAGGSIRWSGPNNASGTGPITVATTTPGTYVYQAVCLLNGCSSAPASATVVVFADQLRVVAPLFDCATGKLTLRTTGGNGGPIEYQIPSVTNGWQTTNPVGIDAKDFRKSLKLRARQRASDNHGYDSAELDYQLPTCPGGRLAASQEPVASLSVVVLGNPLTGQVVTVEVRGAENQPLRLQLTNLQGQTVSEQRVERAGAIEHQTLSLESQPAGMLLLRVSTAEQSQTVRVLRAE